MDQQLIEIPLFPLHAVLFPGMPLPLHVFEERYKLMIQECMGRGRPFGVVLIKSGREVGDPAEPHAVGTSAIITQTSRAEGGRLNIVTVGYQRFRIRTLLKDRPFLSGLVEVLPPTADESAEAYLQAGKLRPQLIQYLALLSQVTEFPLERVEVPEKPILLAFLTGILLQVPLMDKQRLLAAETIPAMLGLEHWMVLRESYLLQANIGTEYTLEGGGLNFSAN